jgi:A/G-specific adenine glycosylase
LFDSAEELLTAVPKHLHTQLRWAPAFVHVLTHKDLHLHACFLDIKEPVKLAEGAWYSALQWPVLGLPAPVRQLLAQTA